MKSFFRPLLLLLTLSVVSPARAEIIRAFHTEIHANADTSLDVVESIQMDFGDEQRHGIYRKIPVRYRRNLNTFNIYLTVSGVTDEKGKAYHYTTSREWDDLVIKIGDADNTITGVHIYNISYHVQRAVNFFDGAPEIYWNATGNEWPYPILNATARFFPPPGVAVANVKTTSYYGPLGGTLNAPAKIEANSILFSIDNLDIGSGLTIVAGLPAGSVTPPSSLQVFLWFFADWWPLMVFPLLAAGYMGTMWYLHGRDVEGNLPAQVEWSPPKDLSPAEVGTLIDESCDMQDIISTLIDLAARGYLRIEEEDSKTFLNLQSKDYIFRRMSKQKADDVLAPHESAFLKGLFGTLEPTDDRVTLSSLKDKFYVHLPIMRSSIYESMLQKQLFTANPETTRANYESGGCVLTLIGLFLGFVLSALVPIAYPAGIVIAGLIIYFGARAMPAKTATGSRKLRECQGFQRFVQLAEKDRIAKLITDDPTIFGRLLPYAMVLGVGDQWANKFAGLLTEPPDWYSGSSYNNGSFSTYYFVNSLNGGMTSMGKTFESKPAPPSSTGGGGGSGFSGGGSGGGFGGGGGGSW